MDKVQNPVILRVIHHRQNPLEHKLKFIFKTVIVITTRTRTHDHFMCLRLCMNKFSNAVATTGPKFVWYPPFQILSELSATWNLVVSCVLLIDIWLTNGHTHPPTHSLTPCSLILLEKIIIAQLVCSAAFCESRRFMAVYVLYELVVTPS
jgi:hypothetical protein